MDVSRKNEIAFLFAMNALRRERIRIPEIAQVAQALDVLPKVAKTFLKNLKDTSKIESNQVPKGICIELSYAFLKFNTKEDGFTFTPLTLRSRIAETAYEIGITKTEAYIFAQNLLKEIIDEIFSSEFE